MTPLFHVSFSQRFHFCHYFFSKILLRIGSHILDTVGMDVLPRFWWERCNPQRRCSQARRNKFCVGFQRRITKEKPFGLFFGPARQAVIKISRLISIAILRHRYSSSLFVPYLLKYRLSKDNNVRIYILNRVFLSKYFSDR